MKIMSPSSPWPDRIATLTMVIGLGAVVIGVAAALSLWNELRWAFYIASAATGLAFLACIPCCHWSKFGKPAIGVVALLLFWLCIGMQTSVRDGNSNRTQTLNNFKQVGLGLSYYDDHYKHLPTDVRNEAREPILSWRVQILPFVEQMSFYKQFD